MGKIQSSAIRKLCFVVGVVMEINDRPAEPVIFLPLGSSTTAHVSLLSGLIDGIKGKIQSSRASSSEAY